MLKRACSIFMAGMADWLAEVILITEILPLFVRLPRDASHAARFASAGGGGAPSACRRRRPGRRGLVSGADCKVSAIAVPCLLNVRGPVQRVETCGAGERVPLNLMRIMPPQGSVSSPPLTPPPSVQAARTTGI